MRAARVRVLDEYAEDGESVVMLADGRVVALSALATAVLANLDEGPLEVEALADRLVSDFGPPPGDPDAHAATSGILTALSDLGLLVLVEKRHSGPLPGMRSGGS